MADKKPPLSTQTSNQKCDRLDFENDFSGKIAARFGVQQENSDLEEGEIYSCESTDDETIEELTAKQKLLQDYLINEDQSSSSCFENRKTDEKTIDQGHLYSENESAASASSISSSLLAECQKSKVEKTAVQTKLKLHTEGRSPVQKKKLENEGRKDHYVIDLQQKDNRNLNKDLKKENSKETYTDPPNTEINSLLLECRKIKGSNLIASKQGSKCPIKKGPEINTSADYYGETHQTKNLSFSDVTTSDHSFNQPDSDNLEDMLDNLEEMPTSSSNSGNESDKQITGTHADSRIKRKHSAESHATMDQDVLNEPRQKKAKTDDTGDANVVDNSKSFHQAQEFQIIDDLAAEDPDGSKVSESEGGPGMDDGDYMSDDLDDNEIYAWLEEGVSKKSAVENDMDEIMPVDEKEKSVLVEKGVDPFEVLPEGWVAVTHNSGMPTYLHKQSRVCTLSKPYFLGPGSVRKHDIPLSAIPCLQYRKELEKERQIREQQFSNRGNQTSRLNGETCPVKENGVSEAESTESSEMRENSTEDTTDLDRTLTFDEKIEEASSLDTTQTDDGSRLGGSSQGATPGNEGPKPLAGPPVKIESAEERKKENSLSAEEVLGYCKQLFEFKTVTVKKFKTWKERRKHLNEMRKQSRPALPANTKLITCSITADDGSDKPKKKEFVLNPVGKSPVCILHEYAQHTLKVQPRYSFQELENAQNPYSATVIINGVEYGKGYASSKKLAKMNAAKATLGILIPEMNKIDEEVKEEKEDLSFFDEIKIEDPRVFDLCTKTGQPSPYQILLECLKRNYGMGDTHVQTDVKTLKHQKSEYTLTVGKHSVTIVCKNKREGKQRAAQAMLQQLHTHINSLGSLLRLYGQSSGKIFKEKRKEEISITELQTQTHSNKPNTALLEKLRKEMAKLQSQRKSLTSKGSLLIDNVPGGITSLDL